MNNKVKFLRGTSDEYAIAEKDNDTIYFTTDDGKLYIGDKEVSGDGSITIDDTLSDTSTNPVQNKVVKQAIDNKADKSLYGDTTINVGRKSGTTVGAYSTAEGYETTANGMASHAEGSNYNLSGSVLSDRTVTVVEGPYFDPVSVDYTISGSTAHGINSHAEGTQSFAHGYSSHAEGGSTTASASCSHAEGDSTTASGNCSHAEGNSTTASGSYSHAGGNHTKALHNNEVAYGKYNESNDNTLFSVGDGTSDTARHNAFEITTTGGKLHDKNIATTDLIPTTLPANGGDADTIDGLHASDITASFALKSLYSDTTINVGRRAGTKVGDYSTAEGFSTEAGGTASHAEGGGTRANSQYSHAEGGGTAASGNNSHAEGHNTTASGNYSHSEGANTTASSNCSHAEGLSTTASGHYAHAEGYITTAANIASHAGGHCNVAMATDGTVSNTSGTAFVIGNGTSFTALSNAFSVQFDGTVKAKSTITASTTADYAEFFEWLDSNPDNEDRVGYFVTLDGNKIRIATNEDDYILGVVSGEPFVLGNGDCDTWNGMFLRDEFRRTIYEPAPKMVEILDSEGNPTGEFEEVEGEFEGTRPKLNPEYDHTQVYISRFDRKEWAPVGMLGVLAVRHDGTAVVNEYVTVNADGIATACEKNAENSYRVIKANSDSVVEIIFR